MGYSIRFKNLTDLAGNLIDSTANTNIYTSTIPRTVELRSPVDLSVNTTVPTQVQWRTNGATICTLQVSTSAAYTPGPNTQTIIIPIAHTTSGFQTTSYNVTNITAGTLYYWHVRAENAQGQNAYTADWRFTP